MLKRESSWLIAVAIMLVACGPGQALGPTLTAIPTNTPLPTDTPAPTYTPSITPTPEAGAIQVSPVDGMVMVYIPAGEFTMGSDLFGGEQISLVEQLETQIVFVDSFWIDQTEVTYAMYGEFIAETGYQLQSDGYRFCGECDFEHPFGPDSDYEEMGDYPAVKVSYRDASQYCQWAGRRLPTEEEWEKAARGTDGRIYPWGNEDPTPELANLAIYDTDGYEYTAPVGSYPEGASPYGVLDMAGNVSEYIDLCRNRDQPISDCVYILHRGGSWYEDFSKDVIIRTTSSGVLSGRPDEFRMDFSQWEFIDSALWNLGFRCAYSGE